MELSAGCVSKAFPSAVCSSFSDHSHLQFYGLGRSSSLTLSNLPPKLLSRRSSAPRFAIVPVHDPPSEQALTKELAELKLQMKKMKKELKAYTKEDKKKMKVFVKEERKRKKQMLHGEGKMKMKCDSESSMSSSESCDEDCTSVSMKMVRESRSGLVDTRGIIEKGRLLDMGVGSCSSSRHALLTGDKVVEPGGSRTSSAFLGSDATDACAGSSYVARSDQEASECFAGPGMYKVCKPETGDILPCRSRVDGGLGASARSLPPILAANRIEVCSGGKCKKAGSQQLLLELQGQIPPSASLEAVPCKCMGKCAMGVNVRVLKENSNLQHHSHVGVEDGSLLLSHHFGIGPSEGISSSPLSDGVRDPLLLLMA